MRLFYATAAALAPLLFAAGAQAQVVINTTRTTPIQTANANNGAPANVQIASGGTINLTSGAGVTINSDNTLEILGGGAVSFENAADGATGVLVQGGVTTGIRIAGSVTVTGDLTTYPDNDEDGDVDGPWATGSGRYGIRATGPMTGDLRVETSGGVTVQGNDSWAIAIEDGMVGDLTLLGTLRSFGDRTTVVGVSGVLDGDAYLGGNITALGEDAVGVHMDGDVTGGMIFQSNISASGYRYTTRPSDAVIAKLEPDDLLQGGPAVWIGANVAGGVRFDGTPTESNANSTDDDGDGVVDAQEIASRVQSYGEAPAVLVGSTTQTVTLGAGSGGYGFVNNGIIQGNGVYDEVRGQGLRFGVDGGMDVVIDGGVSNTAQISGLAFDADATAVRFGDGVSTSRFDNTGVITAATLGDEAMDVTAIHIEAGASVSEFTNSQRVVANAAGAAGNVTAILDESGSLTSITNTQVIEATFGTQTTAALTGSATAIDVRANTTGVTVMQNGVASTPSEFDPDTDGDGVVDSREPSIVGDVFFGSGADVLDVRNGVVAGNVSFGAGADQLLISGGAVVAGEISDADGALDIEVNDGRLTGLQTTATQVSNLTVGGDGRLVVSIDPDGDSVGRYDVSGTATLEDGAQLGVRFNALVDGTQRYVLIDANTLNLGAVDFDSLEDNSPFLFVVEGGADAGAGQVYVDVRRRTATEAGLEGSELNFYDAFYDAVDTDDDVLATFLAQTDREGFANLYEQMLPEHSGGPLLSLASGVDAVTRALVGRNASAAPGRASAWMQEITFYADKDRTDTYGFRSEGFGLAGGVETGTSYGDVGLSLAFTSSDLEDPEAEAEEVVSASLLELGLYWRAQGQYWTTWARAAGGYATFDSKRRLVAPGLNLTNTSSWNGWTAAVAGGASIQREYGRFTVRPEVYAEYFYLSEDAHTESGGGSAFDLEIDERDGHMFSATAAINVAMSMGQNSWLKPEVRLGWRQNISVDPGATVGRFVGGGTDFAINPEGIEGGGPILGFRLNIGNELGMLSVSADAEMIEDYVRYMLLLRASFRF